MRVAILSDIHGNSLALDAVLEDIREQGDADAYWVLGDLAAIGPDPIGVLERIYQLPNAVLIRGNTDRYLVTGERPPPRREDVVHNPSLLSRYAEIVQTFAWTQGAITRDGWLERLAQLPLEYRTTLPDDTHVLIVHAAPGTDDGMGVNTTTTQAELDTLFASCDADLVFVGHTHEPLERQVGNIRLVNPGSISNPLPPDLRAKYIMLDVDSYGHRIERRFVEYDRASVVTALEKMKHPGAAFIVQHMRGERKPPWG
jgi:putative phosphoesterase